MLGLRELKASIAGCTESTVPCPVKGCPEVVERQRKSFKSIEQFQCPRHHLCISPTTFEYADPRDNLLWTDAEDRALGRAILRVKRESRMARDNSEDAVTWNVFRGLEKAGYLSTALSAACGAHLPVSELIYWSYSPSARGTWEPLRLARREFGESPGHSSEPDLIALTDRAVIWIEAKVTATNETTPTDPSNPKQYLTGGKGWFQQVFATDYPTLALTDKKYELLRFWLLGSWSAHQLDRDFYLVNLVLAEREKEIERSFGQRLKPHPRWHFVRLSWEAIYENIAQTMVASQEKDLLLAYFQNKSIGYDAQGRLQAAFLVPHPE